MNDSKPTPTEIHEPSHSEDGVDLTLIRWMLAMTPAERLQILQESVRSLLRLKDEAGQA